MASQVMQQMEQGLEMIPSREVHMLASLADGKQFFNGGIGKTIKAANSFNVSKAKFVLQNDNVAFGLAVIILCPLEPVR